MRTRDEIDAAKALIAWMQSQDIAPADGLPVLARAMVVAVASLCDRDGDGRDFAAGIEAASATVKEAAAKMGANR